MEVCRAVRSVRPSVSGLLLTAAEDERASAAAVLAGAAGYLIKVARNYDIVGAIRKQRPGTSQMEVRQVDHASELLRSLLRSLVPPVTEEERRFLDQILEGRTDGEIVAALAPGDAQAEPHIVAFVARMADALLGARSSDEAGTGRHRRVD